MRTVTSILCGTIGNGDGLSYVSSRNEFRVTTLTGAPREALIKEAGPNADAKDVIIGFNTDSSGQIKEGSPIELYYKSERRFFYRSKIERLTIKQYVR